MPDIPPCASCLFSVRGDPARRTCSVCGASAQEDLNAKVRPVLWSQRCSALYCYSTVLQHLQTLALAVRAVLRGLLLVGLGAAARCFGAFESHAQEHDVVPPLRLSRDCTSSHCGRCRREAAGCSHCGRRRCLHCRRWREADGCSHFRRCRCLCCKLCLDLLEDSQHRLVLFEATKSFQGLLVCQCNPGPASRGGCLTAGGCWDWTECCSCCCCCGSC